MVIKLSVNSVILSQSELYFVLSVNLKCVPCNCIISNIWCMRYYCVQVSGSSAKLDKDSAYHHFTLLLNINQSDLSSFLKPHLHVDLSSSIATASVMSNIINLCALHPEMSHDNVTAAVADKFYQVHGVTEG